MILMNQRIVSWKTRLKKQLLKLLNIVCLLFLLSNGINITSDYLEYNYSYKLIVDDNKEGYDWKDISVCTENNVLFDKSEVILYFGLENQWTEYNIMVNNYYHGNLNNENLLNFCIFELKRSKRSWQDIGDDNIKWKMNLCLTKFFEIYKNLVFEELSFYEMNGLTVEPKELFDCSALLHLKNNTFTSNKIYLENCFEKFQISKSIYVNNHFGICYNFFKKNYNILMKDNDQINITLKFEKQKDFLIIGRTIDNFNEYMHSLRYFVWFVWVRDRYSSDRESSLQFSRVGFDAKIGLQMTSNQLLSYPYMEYCVDNGKFFFNWVI